MAKKSYYELLKDPRWQKRRLEIMERDGFACRECHADNLTLNVHHTCYRKGAAGPWDYPDSSLTTLCEKCHMGYEIVKRDADEFLGLLPLALQAAVVKIAERMSEELSCRGPADALDAVVSELHGASGREWYARLDAAVEGFRGQATTKADCTSTTGAPPCPSKDPEFPFHTLKKRFKRCVEAVASLCATDSDSEIAAHIRRVAGGSLERARREFGYLTQWGLVFRAASGEYFLHPKTAAELDNLGAAS